MSSPTSQFRNLSGITTLDEQNTAR